MKKYESMFKREEKNKSLKKEAGPSKWGETSIDFDNVGGVLKFSLTNANNPGAIGFYLGMGSTLAKEFHIEVGNDVTSAKWDRYKTEKEVAKALIKVCDEFDKKLIPTIAKYLGVSTRSIKRGFGDWD